MSEPQPSPLQKQLIELSNEQAAQQEAFENRIVDKVLARMANSIPVPPPQPVEPEKKKGGNKPS